LLWLIAVRSTLILLVAGPALAQAPARELDILHQVSEHYSGLKSYELRAQVVVEMDVQGRKQSEDLSLLLAGSQPGRLHEEVQHPQQGSLRVSDGHDTWTYVAAFSQYTREPAAAPDPTTMDSAQVASAGIAANLLYTYRTLDRGVKSARILREEPLRLENRARPCYVMEIAFASPPRPAGVEELPRLYWIDRERQVVLKSQLHFRQSSQGHTLDRTETVIFTLASLDRPVADSLFVFHAPTGAKEVAHFSRPGVVDLSGQPASDFTLKDLSGRTHSLKGQRGKVVLLDFWATWCGPCRMQMPNVEKLHNEFRRKGLVVYAINQRESAQTARAYLQKNKYTTLALLDTDGKVGERYHVTGIPSLVVIDRKGVIAAHYVGVHSESDLRSALQKAGLK
jgi:thiol-disulfide isomerase/thioredoxin/outer membrane lipoprotein-sorting protein